MSETIEGMAIAYWTDAGLTRDEFTVDIDDTNRLKAALLWLADNVSDEMSIAAVVDWQNDKSGGTLQEWLQSAISAALRAAGAGR